MAAIMKRLKRFCPLNNSTEMSHFLKDVLYSQDDF